MDNCDKRKKKLPQLEIKIAAKILRNVLNECGIDNEQTSLEELENKLKRNSFNSTF